MSSGEGAGEASVSSPLKGGRSTPLRSKLLDDIGQFEQGKHLIAKSRARAILLEA